MNESTPFSRALTAAAAAMLALVAVTAGLVLGAFAFIVLSLALAIGRLKLWAVGGRRIQAAGSARTGTVLEGRYEVLKEQAGQPSDGK